MDQGHKSTLDPPIYKCMGLVYAYIFYVYGNIKQLCCLRGYVWGLEPVLPFPSNNCEDLSPGFPVLTLEI